jgi:hypothetical protein
MFLWTVCSHPKLNLWIEQLESSALQRIRSEVRYDLIVGTIIGESILMTK